METSAKTAMNVNEMFLAIGETSHDHSQDCLIRIFTAKKLPKVDPATSRQATAAGQRGGTGGRVIDVTHEESGSQGGCCKNQNIFTAHVNV